MRFVVDGMLGGLARWLRMLGYDTDYDSALSDNLLLQRSQMQETILLTRDLELHKRAKDRGIASVLVVGETEDVRLAHLARDLGISLEVNMASTRCPRCGSILHEVSKDEASRFVPEKSLQLYDRFWKCTKRECAKTYWIGSHWKRIRRTLESAQKISTVEQGRDKC